MFCKYCGKQIRDDSRFCEFCGGRLVDMPNQADPSSQPGVADPAEGTFYQGYEQSGEVTQDQGYQPQAESPKSGKRGLLIAGLVVAVCVVVGICVGIVFLLQSQKGSEDETAVAHQINEAIAAAEQVVKSSQEKMLLAAQEKQAQEEAAAKEAAEKEAAEREAAEREAAEKEAAEREAAEKQRLAEEEARKNAWKEAYLGWGSSKTGYDGYYLQDLNKDGIPEILCFIEGDVSAFGGTLSTIYVFSYNGQSGMIVDNVLEGCRGFRLVGTKLIRGSRGAYKDYYEIFFLDETGKLQSMGMVGETYYSKDDIYPYEINGKDVTREEYEQYWDELYQEEGVSPNDESFWNKILTSEELIAAIQNYPVN